MTRRLLTIILILCSACTNKQYVLTINNISPDKSKSKEIHSLYADNDTSAYSQATVIFFLAAHAYRKTAEESKPFVTQPIDYLVVDGEGKNLDSVLTEKVTQKIKSEKKSAIN